MQGIVSSQSIIPKSTTHKPKATELTRRPRYQTRLVTRREQAVQREKEEQESARQLRYCQLLVEDWVRYKQINQDPSTEGEPSPPASINWETECFGTEAGVTATVKNNNRNT